MRARVLCVVGVALAVQCAIIAYRTATPAFAAAPLPDALPDRLIDTGLYAADGRTVDPRNRQFSPQYPLWSDGLTKRRWVYLPDGAAIDARDEHDWNFPVGTKFWKEFSLNGRKVETRLLWKTSESRWTMAAYAWNEEGTEAVLAPAEGVFGAVEVSTGRRHSIPSRTDCAACHGVQHPRALGFTALQLSTDRDSNAIHGVPLEPGMVTLATLADSGVLRNARSDLTSNPPRIRSSDPVTRSVLGYMVANCAMCHNGRGEIAAVAPIIRDVDLTTDGDAVARGFVGMRTRWQMNGVADGETVLVHAGSPQLSAMIARMRSRSPSSQMPPLGTVLRDDQAVETFSRWVEAGPAPVHASRAGGEQRRR